MQNRSHSQFVQYGILAVCAIVIIVCSILLVKNAIDYARADSFYDDMTLDTNGYEGGPVEDGEETPERVLALMDAYLSLKERYPNVIGYINIPSVSISYPVVQWTDNEYYTTHLVSGEENKSGSIFLDFRVDPSPALAQNFILYGHNMNDKTMFHNIRDLFVEETFRNTQVEYVCDEGVFLYDSLSVYVTYTNDPYYAYSFYDEETFASFFEERASMSRFEVEYEQASNLITLVTCSNSATKPDQRFLYHGMLVKAYTDFGEES